MFKKQLTSGQPTLTLSPRSSFSVRPASPGADRASIFDVSGRLISAEDVGDLSVRTDSRRSGARACRRRVDASVGGGVDPR